MRKAAYDAPFHAVDLKTYPVKMEGGKVYANADA